MRIALATFVKTPGMSPIKTRLAAEIGPAQALEFYIQSLARTYNTIEEVKNNFSQLVPYWSVAEKNAIGALFWQKWPQIWQGEGPTLGDRLALVYTELKRRFDVVAFYGADSPHISAEVLSAGLVNIVQQKSSTVVGPTEDGGFYFLASKAQVLPSVWQNVVYSQKDTLTQLKANWPEPMFELPTNFDIDTKADWLRAQAISDLLT